MMASRTWPRSFRVALTCVAALLALSCTAGGVVGGRCRDGLIACNGQCINPSSDVNACGVCGNACPAGQACHAGVCGGGGSGTAGYGSGGRAGGGNSGFGGSIGGAAGSPSGGTGGSSGATGGSPSGGTGGSSGGAGGSATGGSATGGVAGAGGSATGGVAGAGGSATGGSATGGSATGGSATGGVAGAGGSAGGSSCDAPLVWCSEQCVDLNVDPDNCGTCGHSCVSGLCQGGQCVGANVGHIVLECMDFTQTYKTSAQSTLLGNAIFIPLKSPVRILAYAQYVDARARLHVDDTIASAAQLRGRTYKLDAVTTEVDVRTNLSILDYDVLLVYDQPLAPTGELAQTGALWAGTLDSFVRSGGVVVALDGGDAKSETRQLIQSAALLDTTAASDATSTTLYNRAPADGVGLNVISPYFALRYTCAFQTSVTPDADTVFVVTNKPPSAGLGDPVVVHRIRAP